MLKRNVYNKTALKKTVVFPLRNLIEKPKRRKKMTMDKEKQILTSLVYNQIKQQEGQSTETLVGIGIAEKPPLFFNQDGSPFTNPNKSSYRAAFLKRYGENDFFFSTRESIEKTAVLVDGMPILFLTPVMGLATFGGYVQFLFNRKIFLHFQRTNKVHLAFDVPYIWGFNLKKNIQTKRDSKKGTIPEIEGPIHDNMEVPGASKWGAFLANRNDKRKLVLYIGEKLLAAKHEIPPGKTIIVSGCFSDNQTYMIQKDDARALPELKSNHEEADTRIFAHAAWSKKNHLEIVAADTDILAIFLLNQNSFSNTEMEIRTLT